MCVCSLLMEGGRKKLDLGASMRRTNGLWAAACWRVFEGREKSEFVYQCGRGDVLKMMQMFVACVESWIDICDGSVERERWKRCSKHKALAGYVMISTKTHTAATHFPVLLNRCRVVEHTQSTHNCPSDQVLFRAGNSRWREILFLSLSASRPSFSHGERESGKRQQWKRREVWPSPFVT